ncbi:hypothetical protein AB4552_16685 [Vibrio sp. 10N.222.54.C3]|uniref:hypothetical protein n=1 Tax=Vibrio TaxID=662 RepID=UPI00036939F6|nr:hypothetical protein [Vibrio cyclitrophicus]OEE81491.1 hypothetical protein OAI_11875 [Vibrio cyclitrophicus FF160]PMJ19682.1 hypothetical protein BCU28_14635 [Vibrio cyclitrophicus]
MFRKLFEEALEKEAQKRDVFINEFRVSSGNHEELFSSYNIPYDEIISFSGSSGVGDENLDMPAFTNFFLNDGDAQAAIFIKDTVFEEDDEHNHLWKYIMLIHEIGHVNDFRKSKYLNWKKRECDIVMSESFAEIYSIKYFSRRTDRYHRSCRGQLALRILGFEHYGDDYKSIFQQILKTYPRKKLIQWSRSIHTNV